MQEKTASNIRDTARELGLPCSTGTQTLYNLLSLWLYHAKKTFQQDFITTNIDKLAKRLNVSSRTIDSWIASLKHLNVFEFYLEQHPHYGRQMVITKAGCNPCRRELPEPKKLIHKDAVFTKPERSFSPLPYIENARESKNLSKDTMSRSIPSSTRKQTDKNFDKKVLEEKKSARLEQPPSDDFALKAYQLYLVMIAANLSNPVPTHQKTFERLILPLRKSHFGTLEAVKTYFGKIAINSFLMGQKPNKDGKKWIIRIEHILTGKMVEQSWSNEGFFNVYTPRTLNDEEEERMEKTEPVKLPTLTLEEVAASAKDDTDLKVKTALFQKLGAATYRSWFFDNGFTFLSIDGTGASFDVSGNYARKIINERYSYLMAETGYRGNHQGC